MRLGNEVIWNQINSIKLKRLELKQQLGNGKKMLSFELIF